VFLSLSREIDDLEIEMKRCEYELQDPHDDFDASTFGLIRDSVLRWGGDRDTSCYIEKNPHGFNIIFYSSEIDRESNCLSLRDHLATRILPEMEKKGLVFVHRA